MYIRVNTARARVGVGTQCSDWNTIAFTVLSYLARHAPLNRRFLALPCPCPPLALPCATPRPALSLVRSFGGRSVASVRWLVGYGDVLRRV